MSKQTDFIKKIYPKIQEEVKKCGYGVVSAIVAQAACESSWGESSLSKKFFNFFGMKCGSTWKGRSVNCKTQEEYVPGTMTTIVSNFRAYDTLESGIAGYFDFIKASRYAGVRAAKDYKTYINELKKAGYATSSTYVNTLISIVEKYNLTQYDVENVSVDKKTETAETAKEIKASGYAKSFDKKFAKTYATTDNLRLRDSAGENKKILVTLKKGTNVRCYGYYTMMKRCWLYVEAEQDGTKFTGFCAGDYLKEV